MELICAKKDKENEKLLEQIDDYKLKMDEKDLIIEKVPKKSEEDIRKQIDINN